MADNIQWHPAFYSGMELELRDYNLSFDTEFQLTKGPLSIDLLIIKKIDDEKINVDYADIFRKHNIVEFKSPDDEMNIDTYYKTLSYAGLYKSSGEKVNDIPPEEVTVSLFRDRFPVKMVNNLRNRGFTVTNKYPGIYQIDERLFYATQLVVTSELDKKTHPILRILSNKVRRDDVEAFINEMRKFETSGDLARVDSILQVSVTANQKLYETMQKEEASMCEALRNLMKDDIEAAEIRGEARGKAEGEKTMGALMSRLVSLNRLEDIKRCATDAEYRNQLYKEFNLA